MQHFLLFLFLIVSYNTYATNSTDLNLEEITNKIYRSAPENCIRPILPLDSKEPENSTPLAQNLEHKALLSLEGKISKKDIIRFKQDSYESISLYRAYSQEDLSCLKNNYFILSPLTFNLNIRNLSLRVCGLTDEHIEEIGQFKKLEKLKLHSNLITEKGVNFILTLTQLRVLDLGSNDINDSSVEKLLPSMTNLTELDISDNKKITGQCLNYVLANKSLKKLNIKLTSITSEEFKGLKKSCTHLSKLEYFPRSSNH